MRELVLIRSDRKTLSLSVDEDGRTVARAPRWMKESVIRSFVKEKGSWIERQRERQEKRKQTYPPPDEEETKRLFAEAQSYLPQRTAFFAERMELFPQSVRITSAKKRFGSCSAQNRICFSFLLMQYPSEAIDYVVVHELAHIRYKHHGKEFYELIAFVLPDFRARMAVFRR